MKMTHLIIIIGLVLFIIGVGIGFVVGRGEKPELPELPVLTEQERRIRILLEHKALDSVCVNLTGEVVEVGENRIIIIRDQNQLELKVDANAHISRSVQIEQPGNVPTMEIIELGQIETGKQVGIYAIITDQGEIIARGITVFQ